MPKSQIVEPAEERKAGTIPFKEVPLNQYSNDIKNEVETYGAEALIGIYEDMLLIREFESMLQSIKTQGSYEGIEYDHKGPAHLSIGQEASAVGQAFLLGVDDHILGSHRSHGEILAKGMSSIRKLDEDTLMEVMKNFLDGDCFRVVEKEGADTIKDLARNFLLYGALAEVFGRANGFNRGLGGSMHAFFTPFGILPNNAIVGGSADIAMGASLFKKCNRKSGIVISNVGDASMGCGPTWEAMNFASMRQFHELWDDSMKGGLPIIFNFMNNFYGMGGQTAGETMAFDFLARVGAGVNPDSMHAERVDGYNPLAVADAIKRKKALLEQGDGPVLLETITYRYSGHSPSDASSYRIKEEIEAWQAIDPLEAYAKDIMDALAWSRQKQIDERKTETTKAMTQACRLASCLETSPRLPSEKIAGLMFSRRKVENYDPSRTPELILPAADNPRVQALVKKSRAGIIDGKPVSKNKVYQYRDAIFEAAFHRFQNDSTLVAYGEENRDWGGAFACYRGLTESLPYHRLFNSPISEAAIVGSAVGYALSGGRALVELMYCDFMGRAGDEIFNQLAKWQSMSACVLEMPVVLRVSVGSKYGAQHSQDWCAICNHIPGLQVVFPSTPYDAKGMLNTALAGSDPVVFFESQRLYDIGELFEKEVPEGYYEVPFGPPAQRRVGNDVTIITVGATMYRALEAADILEQKYGVTADVFDCRSITPLDYEPLVESVRKTGKVLLSSDACERGSVMQDIASNLSQLAFDELDAPPVVVGSRNWITPCAEVEEDFFPQPSWMIDAIHQNIMPLPGHVMTTNPTTGEMIKRYKEGV